MDKYAIDGFGWKRLNQQKFDIGGSSSKEGMEISYEKCSKHGTQPHIICLNEGGYNSTSFCLMCAENLREQLRKGLKKDVLALKKLNDIRQSLLPVERREWEKKVDYHNLNKLCNKAIE